MRKPRIGLALGSGSARGWAHIGVIRGLEAHGLVPDVVAGASAGALVGAAAASGQLDQLEAWARELTRVEVIRLLDATFIRGGMMSGDRLMRRVGEVLEDHDIERLPIPFAAVATHLDTGHEIWLREGSMLRAVRASSGVPGLFTPVHHEGRWLIDGGVVNSVPVSVCRALGADYVIGVNLNRYLRTYSKIRPRRDRSPGPAKDTRSWALADLIPSLMRRENEEPGYFEVIGASVSIMQDRIMRSRMAGDPPDIVIDPDLGDLDLWDFHRADEAIVAGVTACEPVADELAKLRGIAELGRAGRSELT